MSKSAKNKKEIKNLNENDLWEKSDKEIQKLCNLNGVRICRPGNHKEEFIEYFKEIRAVDKARNSNF